MANKPNDPPQGGANDKRNKHRPPSDIIEGLAAYPPEPEKKAAKPVEPESSDDAIDLSNPGEGVDLSGISVIEWASLADAGHSSGSEPTPKFDSPSDADMIAQLADRGPSAPAAGAGPKAGDAVEAPHDPVIVEGAAGATAADARAAEEDAIFADLMNEASIDLSAPAPPAGPAAAVAAAAGDDSAIDLSSEGFVFEEDSSAPAPAKKGDSAIDLAPGAFVFEEDSSLPLPGGPGESAAVRLSAPEESGIYLSERDVVEEPVVVQAGPGESAIDLTDEGIDIVAENVAETAPPAIYADSAVDLTGGDEGIDLAGAGGDSAAEKVAAPAAGRKPADSTIDLAAVEAGIDLVTASGSGSGMLSGPGESGIALSHDDIVIDESTTASGTALRHSESGVDLMAESVVFEHAGPGSGSGRDLIAEGLESGVDLPHVKKAVNREEDALDDFLATAGGEDQSSSVDLGSAHNISVFRDEDHAAGRPSAADSDIHLENLGAAGEETAGIDLEAVKSEGPASGPPVAESGINLTMAHVVGGEEGGLLEETIDELPARKVKAVEDEADLDEEEAPRTKTKPEPAEKPRGRAGAWLGGTVLGAVVATAACLGVWVIGVEPPHSLRELAGAAPVGTTGAGTTGAGNGAARPGTGPTFEDTLGHIRGGDLERVKPEDLARADESKPEHLVSLAEFAWLNYLKSERGKDAKAPLKADAEPVKKALGYLDKAVAAKNARALLMRGEIHELTGKADEAKKDYEQGKEQFKDNAEVRGEFETALLRLEFAPKVARLAPALMPAQMLAMLLIAFQGDAPAPPAGAGLPEEAGYPFWQSLKLARDGKLPEAVKALEEARERHDRRRYLRPRKQQNPASDPREDIFLRAVDQLKAYWALLEQLKAPNYLTAKEKDRAAVIEAALKKVEDAASLAMLKKLSEELAKDKPVATPDDLVKLVSDERKANTTKLEELTEKLLKANKDLDATKETLVKTMKDLTGAEDMLKASVVREKELQTANTAAATALKKMAETLGVEFKDLKTSGDELVREAGETKRIARIVDPKGAIRRLERELAADRATLKLRWTPEEMLTYWRPLLQSDRSQAGFGEKAQRDAALVLADAGATEVQKGRALTVRGLALRNEEKYAEAKPVLEKAKAALAKTALAGPADWLRQAEAALGEVTNPAAALAQRADVLVARNQTADALALLERGIKSAPGEKGALYAQKALIGLEAARAKGARAGDPLMRSARNDAEEAAKEGLAQGHYAAGRVAEELGQLDEAIKSYRAAVAALKEGDEAGSRYKVALARALLKSRGEETPGVRPLPPPVRTGKAPARKGDRTTRAVSSVRGLSMADFAISMMVLSFQAADLPLDGPKAREAEKLADEILALGEKAPFDARAQALAVKGLYTRALLVYTTGLREKGLLAPVYANALQELIRNHPVLRRPESLAIADPVAGEKRYAAGLNFYFARRYLDAEKELLSAVENDNGDARYYYFLGLARLAQGKREGYEDFDQGARLERLGRPDRGTVSRALERVQGPVRRELNEVRNRPLKDRAR